MLDFYSTSELEDLVHHINRDTSQTDLHIQRLTASHDFNFNDTIDSLHTSVMNPLQNSVNTSRQTLDRVTKVKYVEEQNKGGVKRPLDDSMEENWVVIGRGEEKRPKMSEGEEELLQRERFTTAQVAQERIMEQYRALGGRVYSNHINFNDPFRAKSRPYQAFSQWINS